MTAPSIITTPRQSIWDRMGTDVAGAVTAEDAIVRAGLNWDVKPFRLHREVRPDSGEFIPVERQALVRDDSNEVLGYSGLDYGIIQNIRAFEVLNPLVDAGLASYFRAGELSGGRKVYVQVKFNFDSQPVIQEVFADRDIVPYGTYTGSHDGTSQAWLGETHVCIICRNTFAKAEAGFRSGKLPALAVRHTKHADLRLVEAAQELWEGIIERNVYLATQYKKLRAAKMDDAMFLDLVGTPIIGEPPKEDSKEFVLERYRDRVDGLLALFHGDATGIAGDASAYDAWMTATEVLDHDPKAMFTRKVELETVLIGARAERKDQVFYNLTKYAE